MAGRFHFECAYSHEVPRAERAGARQDQLFLFYRYGKARASDESKRLRLV